MKKTNSLKSFKNCDNEKFLLSTINFLILYSFNFIYKKYCASIIQCIKNTAVHNAVKKTKINIYDVSYIVVDIFILDIFFYIIC